MIDTIILTIPKSKVISVNSPSGKTLGWDLQSRTGSYQKYVRNPSKQELASGLYFPRLDGYVRRGFFDSENIRIEFSIPKLLYLNNVDEVEEKDFGLVISTLEDRLFRMGIVIQEKDLRQATVSAVHYSKNIKLTGGYTSMFVLAELSKIDIRKSFDFTKTVFTNDGQAIYAYTKVHSFVAYDKVADLDKNKKRAIDKDQTLHQRSLFEQVEKREMFELLRFEIRLSKKQKMNAVLGKLGFKQNPTFEEVFNKDISRVVVQHYWQTIVRANSLLLFSFVLSPKDVLKQIFIANPKLKPKQALYFGSLVAMTKDGNGLRELRAILGKYSDQRSWYRLRIDVDTVAELLKKVRPRDWFDQIEVALNEYKCFKLEKS